ncbi:MAG: hypothetical protein JWR83_3337 [Aeromicrobium sp.]|nr:hypothetical protein [Aeromicrobium sp.]
MKSRLTMLLVALPALVAGLLVAAPADAATHNAFVTTKNLAMWRSGTVGVGKVAVVCKSSSTCKGTLKFANDSYKRSYSIPGRHAAYVTVWIHRSNPYYPVGKTSAGDYSYVKNAHLTINESSPSNSSPRTYTDITTETRVSAQQIRGDINAIGGTVGMQDMHVELVRMVRGGNVQLVKSANVTETGHYSFNVALGTNNTPSGVYRLKIRGVDSSDEARSWYFRGASNNAAGGGRYLRDATPVQARKTSDYVADFDYTSIQGHAIAGAEVTVAAPPPSFSGSTASLRELDYQRCGDIFGHAEANSAGNYKIDFLPATSSPNNRYMLSFRSPGGSVEVWYGEGDTPYGSCYDATDYNYSKVNLITLTAPKTKNVDVSSSNNNVTVKANFSSSFKSKATPGDKWIRIREKVPGLTVLESPVVAELQAGSSNSRLFADLRPGTFWIETGRHTGCTDWIPSKYRNNSAYFNGLDRGAEAWKTVNGAKAEYAKSIAMGFPAGGKNPPSGYVGWMYRDFCKAYGTGAYTTRTINGYGKTVTINAPTDPMGAVVKGHVSRLGGKTNKEIMVRLSTADQIRVLRTDVTDGSGNFYIAGLATGTYSISVNSDSWRGIGRTFIGRHSIHVTAGHGYNVGTLHFKG